MTTTELYISLAMWKPIARPLHFSQFTHLRSMVDKALENLRESSDAKRKIVARRRIRLIAETCELQIAAWQHEIRIHGFNNGVDNYRANASIERAHDMLAWIVAESETFTIELV